MFCPKCGVEVRDEFKFCPKCGFNMAQISTLNTVKEAPSTQKAGGLLDSGRQYYLLSEKMWDWGSGDIMDEQGKRIGTMKRVMFSLRADIELKENDGSDVAKIRRKIIALRPTYDILNDSEEVVAQIKQKLLAVIRPALWLETEGGKQLLKAQGNFMRWDFEIYDTSGKKVAAVNKADKWRDVFLKGLFDYSDKYAIQVFDNNVDRLHLLSFAIAIDNMFHDKDSKGNRGRTFLPRPF